jgi:hypothetical protein
MSTNQPWAPTQGAPGGTQQDAPVNGQTAQSQVPETKLEVADENDPRLVSENLDANVEGDAYATPAPPPDGKYRLKLKLEGFKVEGSDTRKDFGVKLGKDGKAPYYTTSVSCSIIDPSGKYDGIVVYPAFGGGVNSRLQRDKSTQVTTLMNRIKLPGEPQTPQGKSYASGFSGTALEWVQRMVKALATEPEVGGELVWETSCQKCGEELKKKGEYAGRTQGMHHFPPETDGAKIKLGQRFQPELKCTVNPSHGYSRARAIVVRFMHIHELPKQ